MNMPLRTSVLHRTLAGAIATAALFASLPATAAEWAARHGLTGAEYQSTFEDLARKGFRLTSISGYESGNSARYAAVWAKKPGPEWAARHGLNAQQYQAAFDDYAKKGYRLSFVNGYSVNGNAYYAGIWTKASGPAWSARHGLTGAQYQSAVDSLSKQGYGLSHVSAYSVGGSPRFAAIFEKGGPAWVARHGLTAAQYQNAFDTFGREGYRLKVVSGYRDGANDRYAALWVKQSGPYYSARHGIPASHYQSVFDNHAYQSYEPAYVQAFNAAGGVRFNATWTNTVFKGADLELIHRKAHDYMRANDMPGLSIAVMRNKRLVYAAGFGVADKSSGLPVSPRHRFRVASVSKPITHVAMLKLMADTALSPTSRVFGANTILGNTWATPSSNENIEDITIQNLIDHRSGFVNINKDGANSDPMFSYNGSGHQGLIAWTLANYPLGFAPGTDTKYSNFGYCLLGRVIEKQTGKSYEAYVRDTQLKPAGAPDIVIGGDALSERKSDEVVYYGGGAYSSVKPKRFDSHGGWIARPLDLLRFMRYQTALGSGYLHYGQMSGTVAVFDIGSGGNGLTAAGNSDNGSADAMGAMLREIDTGVSVWPNVDLF